MSRPDMRSIDGYITTIKPTFLTPYIPLNQARPHSRGSLLGTPGLSVWYERVYAQDALSGLHRSDFGWDRLEFCPPERYVTTDLDLAKTWRQLCDRIIVEPEVAADLQDYVLGLHS